MIFGRKINKFLRYKNRNDYKPAFKCPVVNS